MTGPYDDIIHLPHPTSKVHPRMSRADRAAQFSPFAALTGHRTAIAETARLTDQRMDLDEDTRAELDRRQAVLLTEPQIELDEDAMEELDWKQSLLLDHIGERPEVTVTWFQPDGRKEGGNYITAVGRLEKLDVLGRRMILANGTKIALDKIIDIQCALFYGLL